MSNSGANFRTNMILADNDSLIFNEFTGCVGIPHNTRTQNSFKSIRL